MRIGRARVARGFDALGDDSARATGPAGFSGAPVDPAVSAGERALAPGAIQADAAEAAPRRGTWPEQAPAGEPIRCHFLRSVGADGRLTDPQKTAVPTHRCAAYGDPLPLSLRQQELVCLQRVHVSCPRYVRGTLLANETQAQAKTEERRKTALPIPTLAGIGLVAAAVLILLGGFLGVGPLAGSGAAPSHNPLSRASATLAATATPVPSVAVPSATPSASPAATPSPKPSPTPRPTATPVPSPSWPPGATASRMDLLVPCAGQDNCYVYTVRGSGPPPAGNGSKVADNIQGIANFFGVSQSAIRSLNGLSGTDVIYPGELLKIPPPTR